MSSISAKHAAHIAQRFLERSRFDCENPDPHGPTLAGRFHELDLARGHKVYEFPLLLNERRSGFVIISGDKRLPPVLDYCTSGDSLLTFASRFLEGFLIVRQLEAHNVRWMYFGPFDVVAEVRLRSGSFLYVRCPNLHVIDSPKPIEFAGGLRVQNPEWVASRWDFYERPDDIELPGMKCSTMFGWGAIKYNQTCRPGPSLEEDIATSKNYCGSTCIAGCTPTGWLVLASSFATFDQTTFPLFTDAPDWHLGWETSHGAPPAPASHVLNRRLWDLHDYMGTGCNGTTMGGAIASGSNVFGVYGLNWSWSHYEDVPYSFVSSINDGGLTYLLSGQSEWNPHEVEGHSVVAHGFNDNDAHVQVCLGWGQEIPDRWIPYSVLSSPRADYIHSFHLSPPKEGLAPAKLKND